MTNHYVGRTEFCLALIRDPLIALIEVPTDVSTSHHKARSDRHKVNDNCLARGKGSETQIKSLYEFERRNELDGGAVVEECRFAMKKRLSAIKGAATMRM